MDKHLFLNVFMFPTVPYFMEKGWKKNVDGVKIKNDLLLLCLTTRWWSRLRLNINKSWLKFIFQRMKLGLLFECIKLLIYQT